MTPEVAMRNPLPSAVHVIPVAADWQRGMGRPRSLCRMRVLAYRHPRFRGTARPCRSKMIVAPAALVEYARRIKFMMFPYRPELTDTTVDDGRDRLVAVGGFR